MIVEPARFLLLTDTSSLNISVVKFLCIVHYQDDVPLSPWVQVDDRIRTSQLSLSNYVPANIITQVQGICIYAAILTKSIAHTCLYINGM
jgi:hypothetical protein